jgi:hypothetical protein
MVASLLTKVKNGGIIDKIEVNSIIIQKLSTLIKSNLFSKDSWIINEKKKSNIHVFKLR